MMNVYPRYEIVLYILCGERRLWGIREIQGRAENGEPIAWQEVNKLYFERPSALRYMRTLEKNFRKHPERYTCWELILLEEDNIYA